MSQMVVCPKCGQERCVLENRRQDPKSATTVGAWRITYGLVAGIATLLVGVLAVLINLSSQDAFIDLFSLFFAAIALVLAVYILGTTLYITRWVPIQEMRCQACGHKWPAP